MYFRERSLYTSPSYDDTFNEQYTTNDVHIGADGVPWRTVVTGDESF